jgi:hypothetical protein
MYIMDLQCSRVPSGICLAICCMDICSLAANISITCHNVFGRCHYLLGYVFRLGNCHAHYCKMCCDIEYNPVDVLHIPQHVSTTAVCPN